MHQHVFDTKKKNWTTPNFIEGWDCANQRHCNLALCLETGSSTWSQVTVTIWLLNFITAEFTILWECRVTSVDNFMCWRCINLNLQCLHFAANNNRMHLRALADFPYLSLILITTLRQSTSFSNSNAWFISSRSTWCVNISSSWISCKWKKKKRTLSVGFLQSFPHSETKLFLMLQTLSMHLVMMDGRSERGLIPPKMDPFNVLPNASALRLIVASSFAAAPTTTVRPIPYSSLIN